MQNKPRIGLTMGDPAGIGPEIVLRAYEAFAQDQHIELVVIGVTSIFTAVAQTLNIPVTFVDDQTGSARWPQIRLIETPTDVKDVTVGQVSAEAGQLAYASVAKATSLALEGKLDAIVTAPFSKDALNLAGYPYAGHTELLAHLTGCSGTVMMLAHGNLRISHVSTHVPVSKVPHLITEDRITHVIQKTADALKAFGIKRPRIAVAALNPHAGEGGLFGNEDQDIILPTIERIEDPTIEVSGPHPGDTVFIKGAAGQFDAIIAMYHDQGHIPIKLLGFKIDPKTGVFTELGGINITLGLPIIRTSVDHGTAFDIARKGTANPQSMIEAIDFAKKLASGQHYRRLAQQ